MVVVCCGVAPPPCAKAVAAPIPPAKQRIVATRASLFEVIQRPFVRRPNAGPCLKEYFRQKSFRCGGPPCVRECPRGQDSPSDPRLPLRPCRPHGGLWQRGGRADGGQDGRQGLGRPQPREPRLPGRKPVLEAASRVPPRLRAERQDRRPRE